MYCTHYGLKKKPFDNVTDPENLWVGENHHRALVYLRQRLAKNHSFTVITGNIGSGKTALVRRLVKSIAGPPIVATVPDPDIAVIDFFNFVSDALGMNQIFRSKGEFLSHFKSFLCVAVSRNQKIILIIDEAHRVSHELLQEIHLLLNIDLDLRMPLKPILVGQTELEAILKEKRNLNVRQRVNASLHIGSLTEIEVQAYIAHRLEFAGSSRGIFTPAALKSIYTHSRGYPRVINALCDHALMTGYVAGKQIINMNIIVECINELSITFSGGTSELGAEEEVEAAHGPSEAATPVVTRPGAISPKLNRFFPVKRLGFALALALLLCITGYALLGQLFDLTPAKSGNEQEVKQIVSILGLQSNESNRDRSDAIDFGHEMAEEVTMVDLVEKSQPTESLEFDRLIIQKKIEVPAAKRDVVKGLDR